MNFAKVGTVRVIRCLGTYTNILAAFYTFLDRFELNQLLETTIKVLSSGTFHANQFRERYFLFKAVNEFLSILSRSIVQFG